ncbi:MFS transporter, partial [Klebsiella pneumoniae]|nr:MFS transporter [Klebsiella pneumoniae]
KGDAVVGSFFSPSPFPLFSLFLSPSPSSFFSLLSFPLLFLDERRKAKTGNMLTETIDSERTIRQAERYFIDSNMILNLHDFVRGIFTTKTLPSASLISPIKIRKRKVIRVSVSKEREEEEEKV